MTQNNLQDERLSKKNSVGLDSMTSAGTFELQDKLPLLPIPELKQTCEKFLAWVKPLLNDGEFQKTSLIVKKFMQVDGEGAKLQQSLIEWSQVKGMKSWLEDLWVNRNWCGKSSPFCQLFVVLQVVMSILNIDIFLPFIPLLNR
ncbi:MAG: choline/carnitine O-acyltransferase [Thermodesulfobacteriota bacterium]|nr:choline/carnitine O-acyltransferase [Thermodesulfobacteriota bacterium]